MRALHGRPHHHLHIRSAVELGPPVAAIRAWRIRRWGRLTSIALFGLVWNCAILPPSWKIYHDHRLAQGALRNGDSQVVEGPVEQFHPMPYHGHSLESFTVN